MVNKILDIAEARDKPKPSKAYLLDTEEGMRKVILELIEKVDKLSDIIK